jgi:hypothetical protein
MIGIIHSNWDSDIVLEEGELEKLISGKIVSGEIADYNKINEIYLSKWENEYSGYYFNLEWNKKESSKYHFKITSLGIEKLKEGNYVHGRYENGLNGSKLTIYGPEKDKLTKENIEFAIQMIKLDKKSD